jgi:hypothetical protein
VVEGFRAATEAVTAGVYTKNVVYHEVFHGVGVLVSHSALQQCA